MFAHIRRRFPGTLAPQSPRRFVGRGVDLPVASFGHSRATSMPGVTTAQLCQLLKPNKRIMQYLWIRPSSSIMAASISIEVEIDNLESFNEGDR